jgi:hypothetical protein
MTHLTIRFSPARREGTLTLERQGSLLIANDTVYDLAALAATREDSPGEGWVQSVHLTAGGRLEAVVLLPHGTDAPEAVRFPVPVVVEVDGPVALPA